MPRWGSVRGRPPRIQGVRLCSAACWHVSLLRVRELVGGVGVIVIDRSKILGRRRADAVSVTWTDTDNGGRFGGQEPG